MIYILFKITGINKVEFRHSSENEHLSKNNTNVSIKDQLEICYKIYNIQCKEWCQPTSMNSSCLIRL